MRRGVWCGVIWVCVMMWGCDEKKGSEITPDASGDKKEVVTASQGQEPEKHTDEKQSEEEEESLSDVPEIDSARVKATVEAWAKSQNEGNFEDYKGLYAERFTGVKRVGPKVSQFDRKGWLKDRERMFKKKVTVTLEDMNVHTVSNSAVVRVTQTWASGTFKDTGPKQLVLVPEGDGGELKIAREEMLSSMVLGGDVKMPEFVPGAMGFRMSGPRDDLWVMPKLANNEWYDETKAKTLVRGESAMVPAKEKALPEGVQALKGKTVSLFGPDDKACEAKVEEFFVVGEAVPHFGQRQYWDADPMLEEGLKPASDDDVAQGVMGYAEDSGAYVAARIEPVSGTCKGWTWGTIKPDVKVSTFEEIEDVAMRKDALAFFATLPGYKEIQKDYAKLSESNTDWVSIGNEQEVDVKSARLGGRTYVFIRAGVGNGCDDFMGEFWALFEQGSDFVLLSDGKNPGELVDVTFATDLEGDGTPEFGGPRVFVQAAGPVWRVTGKREIPFFDCGC